MDGSPHDPPARPDPGPAGEDADGPDGGGPPTRTAGPPADGAGPPSVLSAARYLGRRLGPVVALLLSGLAVAAASGPTALLAVILGATVWFAASEFVAYPLSTVGTRRRVDAEPAGADAGRCSVCGDPAGDGERRAYAKQEVLFGVPLRTVESGANDYCRACADPTAPPVGGRRHGSRAGTQSGTRGRPRRARRHDHRQDGDGDGRGAGTRDGRTSGTRDGRATGTPDRDPDTTEPERDRD